MDLTTLMWLKRMKKGSGSGGDCGGNVSIYKVARNYSYNTGDDLAYSPNGLASRACYMTLGGPSIDNKSLDELVEGKRPISGFVTFEDSNGERLPFGRNVIGISLIADDPVTNNELDLIASWDNVKDAENGVKGRVFINTDWASMKSWLKNSVSACYVHLICI